MLEPENTNTAYFSSSMDQAYNCYGEELNECWKVSYYRNGHVQPDTIRIHNHTDRQQVPMQAYSSKPDDKLYCCMLSRVYKLKQHQSLCLFGGSLRSTVTIQRSLAWSLHKVETFKSRDAKPFFSFSFVFSVPSFCHVIWNASGAAHSWAPALPWPYFQRSQRPPHQLLMHSSIALNLFTFVIKRWHYYDQQIKESNHCKNILQKVQRVSGVSRAGASASHLRTH